MKIFGRISLVIIAIMLAMLVAPGASQAASAGVTSTAAITANAAAAAKNTAGATIVFQLSSGGAIYAMDSNGKNLRRLTTGMDPALSPDGKQVAFTRWDGQDNGVTGSLWVINVDGTGERQVIGGIDQPKSPAWSADGKQIIISVQHEGTTTDQVIEQSCRPYSSGDTLPPRSKVVGNQACMVFPADPHWGLRLVNVAEGSYEDLPRDTHSFAPTWDPANAWRVVFRGDKGLESLDLNQGTTSVLAANGAYRGPVFSPDGSKIAVTFKQNDHWEVHVLNANGTGEVRLTQTPSTVIIDALLAGKTAKSWNNAAPAWSPDGKQIVFISDRNGAYEIWAMNADGSNQHVLLSAAALKGAGIAYDGNDERVISWR